MDGIIVFSIGFILNKHSILIVSDMVYVVFEKNKESSLMYRIKREGPTTGPCGILDFYSDDGLCTHN